MSHNNCHWGKRVPVPTSLDLSHRGATSSFNIIWDYLNVLTITSELEAPYDANVGMLKDFFHTVYCLFDPDSTFSYGTPYVTMHLDFWS